MAIEGAMITRESSLWTKCHELSQHWPDSLIVPRATILHLVRDPMDTLWSCYKTKFADDSASYTIDPDVLAKEYGLYIDIMRHFREQMPRASVIDVNYEALVTQPRKTMSLILRRMGRGGGEKILHCAGQRACCYFTREEDPVTTAMKVFMSLRRQRGQ